MVKWHPFTKKQLQILSWWTKGSPYSDYVGIIADGAVRSGKTIVMSLSFILWAMETGNEEQYIIAGKTIGSLRRNLITPLKQTIINRGFKVKDLKGDNLLIISKGNTTNWFYLFGGRDESSQDLVQGLTARGALLDEVSLMPLTFVNQVMARCSITGRKLWFNCNPQGPQHWFYQEHILKAKENKYLRIHFQLEDNPSLAPEIVEGYKRMFSGIFYKRFILGQWAFADGIIYDCFNEDRNTYTNANREKVLPWQILENDPDGGYPYYGSDYGVLNPMVYLEVYKVRKGNDRIPYFYVENEYYYDGRKSMVQKSDVEEIEALVELIGNKNYRALIIDPSASSLIVAARQQGIPVHKAKNDVLDGIHLVYSLMATGHILINKDNCPNLVNELGQYIWNEKRGLVGKEEPLKQNDHACDALRYAIATTTSSYEVYEGIEN